MNQYERGAVQNLKTICEETEKKLHSLTLRKNQLRKEVDRLRAGRLQGDFNHPYLSLSRVHGYTLSNYSMTCKDDEKIYSAENSDPLYSFKFSVTMKGSQVTKIHLVIAENSALKEVQSVLESVAGNLCPHALLMTIQQYIELNKFRMKSLYKLRSSTTKFHVDLPKGTRRHFIVRVYQQQRQVRNIVMEIWWTVHWEGASQALAHSFSTPWEPEREYLKRVKTITDPSVPFTIKRQSGLSDWWDTLCNDVSNF